MACSEGLASDIEQALNMVPIQMIEVLEGTRKLRARQSEATPLSQRPVGTPDQFVAIAGGAMGGIEGVEVIRG